MYWIDRLNRGKARIEMGSGAIEVLSWAYMANLPDNVPHRHTYFEVCLVGAYGAGIYSVEGRDYEIGPGDLFFARPGVIHQIRNTAVPLMELTWVSFQWLPGQNSDPDEISLLINAFRESPVWRAHDQDGRVQLTWQALRSCAAEPRPGFEEQIHALQRALLTAIAQLGAGDLRRTIREDAEEGPESPLMRLAVRYINDNLDRAITVEEVAANTCVSVRHLSRIFAHCAGTSPAAYIARARIDLACALLLRSDAAIKEIATSVGMPDIHHFTRVFTRLCGVPPGRYRRERGSDVPNRQIPGALV
jgi:AraC family L-rhamnose operon transcriptional activator RhaR